MLVDWLYKFNLPTHQKRTQNAERHAKHTIVENKEEIGGSLKNEIRATAVGVKADKTNVPNCWCMAQTTPPACCSEQKLEVFYL